MNEISLIKKSPIVELNRDGISRIVNQYVENLAHNGGEPSLDIIMCRKYVILAQELEKGLQEFAINELSLMDKMAMEVYDSELKVVDTPAKYDYSASKAWVDQKAIVDGEAKKLKDIEAFIKSIKSKTVVVDENTGEAIEYFPPAKSSSQTLRYTAK
jgi:hypothetical protein